VPSVVRTTGRSDIDPKQVRNQPAEGRPTRRYLGDWDRATLGQVVSRADRRGQWLLILAVAAGIIAMHHVLLTCPETMSSTVAAEVNHADPTHAARSDFPSGPRVVAHRHAPSAQSSAMPDAPPEGCGAMSGHLCMAVLGAASTLLVALVLALFVAASAPRPATAAASVSVSARAPPSASARPVGLCVWRC
jgi:hypothetical protein